MRALAVLLLIVIAACDAVPGRVFTSSSSPVVLAATPSASSAASATARPATTPSPTARPIADVLAQIDPAKLDDHMRALASFQSRHPLHPGHAKAVAYLVEQLSAIPGVVVQDIPTAYNGVRLDNILATIAPPGPRPAGAPPSIRRPERTTTRPAPPHCSSTHASSPRTAAHFACRSCSRSSTARSTSSKAASRTCSRSRR